MYLNPPFFSVSCMNNHGVFVRPLGRDVWAFCFGGCDERSSSDQLCACSVFTLTRVCSLTQSCPALQTQGLWPTRLLSLWHFPGKNAGVGCQVLLQGMVLTQESNPHLLHCRQILYCLSHQRIPLYVNFTQNLGRSILISPSYSEMCQKDKMG